MDHWKKDSIQGFCADVLLPKVDHYRSDVFITYERLVHLYNGDVGIVLTRANGCEEYTQQSSPVTLEAFDHWADEATGFFYVRRFCDESYFGRIDSVYYQEVSRSRAKRLLDIIQKRKDVGIMEPIYELRCPLYTGEQLRQFLQLRDVYVKDCTDLELEVWGEMATHSMVTNLDKDMLDAEMQEKLMKLEMERLIEERTKDE